MKSNKMNSSLSSLQKQVRTLQGILLGTAVVLSLVAMRPAEKKSVTAEIFILRDSKGKTRAQLAMVDDGPALVFFDEKGRNRASLKLSEDGWGGLIYLNEKGYNRGMFYVKEELSHLYVLDQTGRGGASLSTDSKGSDLTLYDNNRKIPQVRVRLDVKHRSDGARPAELTLWGEGDQSKLKKLSTAEE